MSKKCIFWDKTIRLILGAALIWWFGFICAEGGAWQYLWLFGAWLIITAVYGCPLYRFLPCCKNKCQDGEACGCDSK